MPTIMLSEHFSLAEFTYSQTASRAGISNQPPRSAVANLQRLAETMEKVRTFCGDNPVTITSGYRSAQVNALVGGATNSAHITGQAADFIIPGFGTPYDICLKLEHELHGLGVDQLIWEYQDWVHLAIAIPASEARCECLTINNAGTTTGFA
jgi:zinc D-Ala-D-Ala carboxypeptidase